MPIFKHYNIQQDVVHASADGQKFEAKRDTFKTRYSSKYFGTQKGVFSMGLIANHAAINARIIGANEHESHYILDLLFNNTSEIKPEVLSTDTHGVNHVNFALLYLFGYSFAPRYAQVGRVINGDRFRGNSDEEILLWNECARLLTNAIIYFNSSVLSHLLKSFEYQKDEQKLAVVKQASPVAWHNINLKGTYRFKSTGEVPDLEQMMRHIEGYKPVR